jgi:protein phosphatase
MMNITVPELAVVALIGPSGSGKSTFARKHFKSTEILSSDSFRALVADDENSQSATKDAFEVLYYVAAKRLAAGRLVVIDATNTQSEARKSVIELAKSYHCLTVAFVFDLPESVVQKRNQSQTGRNLEPQVIHRQIQQLKRSIPGLSKEGFRYVHLLSSSEEIDSISIERQLLWTNKRHEHGPFDIIGDLHGCCDELEQLLLELGYQRIRKDEGLVFTYPWVYRHPQGRKAIFLGDLVDRGPRILDTLQLVQNMVQGGSALCVPGNHDDKFLRKLNGRGVRITSDLEMSLTELNFLPSGLQNAFQREFSSFLDSLISHYVLDDGRLVVAHAGMKENLAGRASGKVRDFALYGETTGETDEFGLPVRYNWASEYRGKAFVVYGHTPVPYPEWLNRTINIDTGCVFGGSLTALRYPEMDLVSVPAAKVYYQPVRPINPREAEGLSAQQQQDELLEIEDVLGKHIINTRLLSKITIREGNSAAALEVMSRFIVNPKWLIYLPPTMSPPETTRQAGFLEHPEEVFAYYRKHGVKEVICEEKHMGSRAVVVICKDDEIARRRFGITDDGAGICYTRTGRCFFDNRVLESEFLASIRDALSEAGFWDEFQTDWFCLDCELMPWSLKAQELIREQYAAVGASAHRAFTDTLNLLNRTSDDGVGVRELSDYYRERATLLELYIEAYRRYCWPVSGLAEMKLCPFHILASEGAVHVDKTHLWHMQMIEKLVGAVPDGVLYKTPYRIIQLSDPESLADGISWWQELTDRGGEGMVVKPLDFLVFNKGGLVQPAMKCRGKEYLRIIYGAEYTSPEHLQQLKQRSVSLKRSLAIREFALGIEALERFARKEPLRSVHECSFGVLALESEPVDPRL